MKNMFFKFIQRNYLVNELVKSNIKTTSVNDTDVILNEGITNASK